MAKNITRFIGRLTAYLVLLNFLSISDCFAQNQYSTVPKISVSGTNLTFAEVFKSIEKQTGLRVFSPSEYVNMKERININLRDQSVSDVLKFLFDDKGIEFKIDNGAILLRKAQVGKQASAISTQDKKTLYGVVTDTLGEPLFGATIKQLSSGIGTITDKSGEFVLQVDSLQDIFVSFTGFITQIIPTTAAGKIKIALHQDVKSMHTVEIYSTGYQNIPKERSTGSFDLIDRQLFNQQVSTNVTDRLEAIANGLQSNKKINGSDGQIIIRGLSSINGPKSPLIIVNNFPYEGNLENINPNDVESITILKDAAAASIWGTRAGNGVIVITTKTTKYKTPFSLDMASNITVQQKPDLFKLKTIGTSDFINLEQSLFAQGYYADLESDTWNFPPLSPVVELLIAARDGKITASQAQQQIDNFRTHDVRNDFMKYFYRDAVNQQYALTLRSGANNLAWLLSAGYDRNITQASSHNDRITIRSENTYKPLENLEIRASVMYTRSTSESGKPQYGDIQAGGRILPPYTAFADSKGNPLPLYQNYRKTYIDTVGGGKLQDWHYYPLTDYLNNSVNNTQHDLLLNGSARYRILDGLDLSINYQYERQSGLVNSLHGANSYYVRNFVNLYTQFDANSSNLIYPFPMGAVINYSNSILQAKSLRPQLGFNRAVFKGDLSAVAGMEVRKTTISTSNGGAYGYNPNNLQFASVDYSTTYPSILNGSDMRISDPTYFSSTENRFVSYFANVAYTYNHRYTVSASGRTDASNLFGVRSNDKWTPLWSAGVAWELSNEKFYKSQFFPYLKLRATYGYSGNVDQSLSATTVIALAFTNPYTNTPASSPIKFYNPDLRWEKVGMTNIGIDFTLKNDILSGSIEFYHKKGVDLYGPIPIDYTDGLGTFTLTKNVASIKGNGFDIQLHSRNINKEFKWTTNLNLSRHLDKVISYYIPDQTTGRYAGSGNSITPLEGHPIYSIYSYPWRGLDPKNGAPQGLLNGQISEDYYSIVGPKSNVKDLIYNGPAIATYYGSFSNTFAFKSISLTLNFLYKFGYYFHRNSISYSALITGNDGHSDYEKRWQKIGDEKTTNVPSFVFPADANRDFFYNASEVLVEKGDNIRLQYATISYRLPLRQVSSLKIKDCNLFVNANNLGIVWRANKEKIDPDYPENVPPISKNIAIGIKITL